MARSYRRLLPAAGPCLCAYRLAHPPQLGSRTRSSHLRRFCDCHSGLFLSRCNVLPPRPPQISFLTLSFGRVAPARWRKRPDQQPKDDYSHRQQPKTVPIAPQPETTQPHRQLSHSCGNHPLSSAGRDTRPAVEKETRVCPASCFKTGVGAFIPPFSTRSSEQSHNSTAPAQSPQCSAMC